MYSPLLSTGFTLQKVMLDPGNYEFVNDLREDCQIVLAEWSGAT
jgi:hypothetical protein